MITADRILSEDQLKRLFNRMKSEKEKALLILKEHPTKSRPGDVRIVLDYFIFLLISNTGLRISEALKITLSSLGYDYISIDRNISKNHKNGTVYFGKQTRRLLDEYIEFRSRKSNFPDNNYLFPSYSSKKGYLSRSYLHSRFKYWLKLSGLPEHYSIHSLRHTYATICLDKGLGLVFVRDQLRHSSISVTSKYLHLTRENREKVKDLF